MNTRRGLGKGLGTGYRNLIPTDSHIHSLSAKGVKTQKFLIYASRPMSGVYYSDYKNEEKAIDDAESSMEYEIDFRLPIKPNDIVNENIMNDARSDGASSGDDGTEVDVKGSADVDFYVKAKDKRQAISKANQILKKAKVLDLPNGQGSASFDGKWKISARKELE